MSALPFDEIIVYGQKTNKAHLLAKLVEVENAGASVALEAQEAAEAAEAGAEAARDAALYARGVFATTAKALSKGVAGYASLVAGSGGTNGTFDIAFSGGAGSGAAGRFVVAGGALVSITITATGDSYTSAPTMSFAASSGLSGASATAVIANNVDAGEYFTVPLSGVVVLYQNVAGVATEVTRFVPPTLPAIIEQRVDLTAPDVLFTLGVTPVNGSSVPSGSTYIIGGRPVPAGYIKELYVWASATATLKVKLFSRSGQDLTFKSEFSLSVVSGLNTFKHVDGSLAYHTTDEGDLFGLYSGTTGAFDYTTVTAPSGTETFSDASDVTTSLTLSGYSSVPDATLRLEFQAVIAQENSANAARLDSVKQSWGETFYVGDPSPSNKADASAASSATTFFDPAPFLESAVMMGISAYTRLAGPIQIYIAELQSDGSYTVTRTFVINCATAAAVNSFAAGVDFPADVIVPENALVGLRTLRSAMLDADVYTPRTYQTINGSPTTNFSAFDTPSTSVTLQIKFEYARQQSVRKIEDRRPRIIEADFATAIPLDFTSTGWSIVSGAAQNSGTGVSNKLRAKRFAYYSSTLRVVFDFTGATDEIAIFREPNAGPALGTILTIKADTGRVAFRDAWSAGGSLPAVNTSGTCSFSFTTGRKYRADFSLDGRNITAVVRDMVTGDSYTLAFTALTAAIGSCAGMPGIFAIAGTVNVYSIDLTPAVRDPLVMIYGDSITHDFNATTNKGGWAAQVATACRGLVSAGSGEGSGNILARIEEELGAFHPAYVIVSIGTNDTDTAVWQANIEAIAKKVQMAGAIPVFCTVGAEAGDSNPESVMNPYLRGTSYRLIEFDRALTTGGTGLSANRNAALYSDTLHPNDTGMAKLVARVKMDLPELYDLAGLASV